VLDEPEDVSTITGQFIEKVHLKWIAQIRSIFYSLFVCDRIKSEIIAKPKPKKVSPRNIVVILYLSCSQPPKTQPIAQARPHKTPVTKATLSAVACQSWATDDHMLAAAPI